MLMQLKMLLATLARACFWLTFCLMSIYQDHLFFCSRAAPWPVSHSWVCILARHYTFQGKGFCLHWTPWNSEMEGLKKKKRQTNLKSSPPENPKHQVYLARMSLFAKHLPTCLSALDIKMFRCFVEVEYLKYSFLLPLRCPPSMTESILMFRDILYRSFDIGIHWGNILSLHDSFLGEEIEQDPNIAGHGCNLSKFHSDLLLFSAPVFPFPEDWKPVAVTEVGACSEWVILDFYFFNCCWYVLIVIFAFTPHYC